MKDDGFSHPLDVLADGHLDRLAELQGRKGLPLIKACAKWMATRPPKLSPAQAENLRVARALGTSYDKLAAFWGIAASTARRYCNGECRAHQERRA